MYDAQECWEGSREFFYQGDGPRMDFVDCLEKTSNQIFAYPEKILLGSQVKHFYPGRILLITKKRQVTQYGFIQERFCWEPSEAFIARKTICAQEGFLDNQEETRCKD
ncbi:hypothetical protein TNCV_397711, partial [Trichonephila clavipes]